jgi:membrane associated rhomboid family serine protease
MTTRRYMSGGGGGGGGTTLSLPPFTRAVKWIIGINVGLYFLVALLGLSSSTAPLANAAYSYLALFPVGVVHGFVWQLVTYSFLHFEILPLLVNMLGIWLLGSLLEGSYGTRWFVRYYVICALGAGLCSVGLAYSGVIAGAPKAPVMGAQGVLLGFVIAFGVLFADTEFMMFPLPMMIKAKYMAGVTIVIVILVSLKEPGGLLQLAQLGGLIAGFIYIKFFFQGRRPARAFAGRGLSDRGYTPPKAKTEGFFARMKNSYYRWKRKRAARKFEVYMRDHDRNVQFDEHGNYIPPASDAPKKGNGEDRGGWVN